MSDDKPTLGAHIIVTDAVIGIRRYVHEDVVDEALRINAILTPAPFDLASIRQHPGVDCCESCLEDNEFSPEFSTWPQCCCRSEIPYEWLEARLDRSNKP